MRIRHALSGMAAGLAAAVLAGCAGVTTTLRYGTDGQPESFIDCSGQPLARCYDTALETCPLGYVLVKESQTPAGTAGGSIWGYLSHIGGSTNTTEVRFQNHVVRCKAPPPAIAAPR